MKTASTNAAKDFYKELRRLGWQQIWSNHVPEFNREIPGSKTRNAGLVRAVGVVFLESGSPSQKAEVAAWLRSLLKDPD